MFDGTTPGAAMIALPIPTFWFALVSIFVFSPWLGWLPVGSKRAGGGGSFSDQAIHLVKRAHCVRFHWSAKTTLMPALSSSSSMPSGGAVSVTRRLIAVSGQTSNDASAPSFEESANTVTDSDCSTIALAI